MTSFPTPTPIHLDLEVGVGDVRIAASDRADTTVEVRPSDPTRQADVSAAEQTRTDLSNGQLTVKGPSGWRQWRPHHAGSIDVEIEVPSGSRLEAELGVAAIHATGRLGDCRAKVGVGDVQLDGTGAVHLKAGAGDLTIEHGAGRVEVHTGSGGVRIGRVDGSVAIKNANGDTWIGEVTGDVRVNAANGKVEIDRAHGSVVAKTANGDVRLGEVAHGGIVAESAMGGIEIGVRHGVAAWLDLQTKFGTVRNDLETSDAPGAGDDTVEVRASTAFGDIAVRRVSEAAEVHAS